MNRLTTILTISFVSCILFSCSETTIDLASYGLYPNRGNDSSPLLKKALDELRLTLDTNKLTTITLPPGRYDFYPEHAATRDSMRTGFDFEDLRHIIFDGQGAEFIFHGQMRPVSLSGSRHVTLRNFHIDFENPSVSQVGITANDTTEGIITFQVAPWVTYEVRDSAFTVMGKGWEHVPDRGVAFGEFDKHVLYRTGDICLGTQQAVDISPGLVMCYNWKDSRLKEGTVLILLGSSQPAPGIFISNSSDVRLENIKIHYAEGAGLLAQASEDITLDGFSVCLRGKADPRYFTTPSYATCFTDCRGTIAVRNGLFESMMDAAIYVCDTPSVVFSNNIIRNNRAHGALFNTPKSALIENNLFDHPSGAAILLNSDSSRHESGACGEIIIRSNTFRQPLTSMYPFSNAVISVYPLETQGRYVYGNILIEQNLFEYFDTPLLYAASVDSLIFRYNQFRPLASYPAYHWNKHRLFLEHVDTLVRFGNAWGNGFNAKTDIFVSE